MKDKQFDLSFMKICKRPGVVLLFFIAAGILFPKLVDADVPALETKNTYAVIVGVLEWEKPAYSSFSKQNRRDQGLYDSLSA